MNKKFMFVIMTLVIVVSIVFSPAVVPAAPNRIVHGEKLAATAPTANFTASPTSGSAPLQVTFANLSTGDFTACLWDFGDGSTSFNCNNPIHIYESGGTYTVRLTVVGLPGESSLTRPGYVNVIVEEVQAEFSASPANGIAPFAVNFTNQSTGTFDTCAWDFGDWGTSEECDPPSHTYVDPGVYTVSLTVSGLGGTNVLTREEYIHVHEPVQAEFSADPTSGIPPLEVFFYNQSSGAYDTCAWDFGDEGTSDVCNDPTHTYLLAGNYTVSLTLKGPGGEAKLTETNYIIVEEDAGYSVFLPLILRGLPTPVTPPVAPILNQINNADGNGNYTVTWSASAGAETYTLQEATDSNFANANTVYSGPNTFKDISGRDVGTYYYRVRAENASGHSDWSNTQSVVVTVPFVPEDWKIIKLPGSGFYPSLALDSAGNPHISSSKGSTYVSGSESWLDGRETRVTGDIQYIRWDGNEWESHVVDTLSITYNANTSLAIDQNDQPQIAYPYWNPGKLVHAAWNGVAWQRTYITGPAPFYVNLALKANGDPCISHLESNLLPNGMDIYYLCRTGETWGMSRYVATVTWNIGNYVSYYHSLALASDGTPHISFYHGIQDSGALLYYSTLVDGLWKSNAVDGKGTGSYSSLALDSQDRPHISYHDHANGDLKYAWLDGDQWQIETIDSSGIVGQFTSLALDGDGHPHISYIDATNQNLKYTFWDGSQWQIEVIDDSGKVWRWTSLALDDSGFAHISYGTWEGLKYATNSGFPGE